MDLAAVAARAPSPLLRTDRAELWLPTHGDMSAMIAIVSDPRTGRFLGDRSGPADHFARFCRNAGSWLLYGYGSFIVRLRDSGEVVGNCGVFHSWRGLGGDFDDRPEAGWILRHDQVGRGLGREVMTAVFEWFARAHGPRRIMCMIEQGNAPSIGLARRLGFEPLRAGLAYEGTLVDLLARPAPAA